MKAIAVLLALCAMLFVSVAEARGVRVRGYTRKDGTYVAPHYRSSPNTSRSDNYSTRGNYNPYTGKSGTVDPYGTGFPSTAAPYIPPTYTPPPVQQDSRQSRRFTTPSPAGQALRWRNFNQNEAPNTPSEAVTELTPLDPVGASVDGEREHALREVGALGAHYRATDPNFDAKFALMQPRIQEIQRSLPASQWVAAIASAWSSITNSTTAVPIQQDGRGECQQATDKARQLADAANNLAKCASWGDFTDDCARQARDARYAADEYEDAVRDANGMCR